MKHQTLVGACKEGYMFASQFDTLEQAWNACENIRWLCWYAKRAKTINREKWVNFAQNCAQHVAHLKGRDAAIYAIYAAEAANSNADAANAFAFAADNTFAIADAATYAAKAAIYAADAAVEAAYDPAAENLWQCQQLRSIISWTDLHPNTIQKLT